MKDTLVILVVGLTPSLIGENTPTLKRLAEAGGMRPLTTHLPAVTCTSQSTLVTGLPPAEHGAVANGWYFRDMSEVWLWRQSNKLIAGEKIWEAGKKRDPDFTCAKMFWWYNMYATADWSATPRPMYPADGRKIPDHYAHPMALRDELSAKFGMFPLFKFWGPLTDNSSSDWIAKATEHVMETREPTLTLCYLPHLDYNLQRVGPIPDHPKIAQDLREVDENCRLMVEHAERTGKQVMICSEYGITATTDAVHINRALRQAGLIAVKVEMGRELLDPGASAAFAVADHQLAHVYVADPARVAEVKALIEGLDGVDMVLDAEGQRVHEINHERAGELVAVSKADRWFSYYYWLDEDKAPDFAPTVDIHRKPGYDPVELFLDPALSMPMLKVAKHLFRVKTGMRSLLSVISTSRTDLVRGSHGRAVDDPEDGPLVISTRPDLLPEGAVRDVDFKELVLNHVFG
jgi:predicted AlkP superfamily pyrophosphatase or phosphodiesterase